MLEVKELNTNEKAQFPNMDYAIVLSDGNHFFSKKGLFELSLKIKKILKPNESKTVNRNENAEKICYHKYDYYTNQYGVEVAVCSKCLKAYF